MADFDDGIDGGQTGASSDPTPQIDGGLLDPRTFPASIGGQGAADAGGPVVAAQTLQLTSPLDTDVHAEVLRDILDAQSQLPPISLDRAASIITGPLRTDPHTEAFQNFMNAQAGLPPVKPGPETWAVNGRPYRAISASNFDPSMSSHVTAMPTPEESAASLAGKSKIAVRDGMAEQAGFLSQAPVRVISAPGRAGTSNAGSTFTYNAPVGSTQIHGHIDEGEYASDGMVDAPLENGGFGDTWSLTGAYPAAMGTVSHNRIGWHVLDNGQLKFLYPAGSIDSSQIGKIQRNLDQEQNNF